MLARFNIQFISLMSFIIVSPTNNQTILGEKVTISFIVGDLEVGREVHLHLWFDNPREEASTAAKIYSSFDHELSDIPAGNHLLTLELVKPDHNSFKPPVKQTINFKTFLPQTTTPTLSPAPKQITSFINQIHWQMIAILTGVAIIILGIAIKNIWGKAKI